MCVSALMPVKSDVYAFMTHSAERVPEPHPRRGPETVARSTFANMLIALGVPGTAVHPLCRYVAYVVIYDYASMHVVISWQSCKAARRILSLAYGTVTVYTHCRRQDVDN